MNSLLNPWERDPHSLWGYWWTRFWVEDPEDVILRIRAKRRSLIWAVSPPGPAWEDREYKQGTIRFPGPEPIPPEVIERAIEEAKALCEGAYNQWIEAGMPGPTVDEPDR